MTKDPARPPLRTVLIGCGEHATVVIHAAAALMADIKVTAVCDLDAARAEDASRRFGGCPKFAVLEEMLTQVAADAAIVVGPPALHARLVVKCIEAGLNVFVEKPLFTSTEDLLSVEDAAKARPDLHVSVSFNKRYSPYIQQVRDILDRETFGKAAYFFGKFAGGYRNGATDLLRVGAIHYFDLARFLIGDIARVSAVSWVKQPGQAHIAVNMVFANGAVGNLFLSSLGLWSAKGAEYLEIRGDQNFVTLENLRQLTWQKPPSSIRASSSSHQAGVEIPSPAEYLEPNYSNVSLLEYQSTYQNGYFSRLEAFVTGIRQSKRSGPGIEDARRALEMALAIEQSIRSDGAFVCLKPTG
jgi:myo-inositol 2-dehydrogenase/D-chiro-inositol 1-dehydrogenase